MVVERDMSEALNISESTITEGVHAVDRALPCSAPTQTFSV